MPDSLDNLPGFNLVFHTVSDRGEAMSQELRALFVPKQQAHGVITGDYLRDRAYEEARPIVSSLRYDPSQRELLMTTPYTRVVSVDSMRTLGCSLMPGGWAGSRQKSLFLIY